jgi:hypothetical protein
MFDEMGDAIAKFKLEIESDIAQECYLQCLAVECGEGECARAIRTKFPNLISAHE